MTLQLPCHTLFIRLDRIGDLVLSLPVDGQTPSGDGSVESEWWIPPGLSFVTAAAEPARSATEVKRNINVSEFFARLAWLRARRFQAAVVFHAPWWVSFLLWLARVPIRVGVKSQWHSFLFLNRGVRQKRSRSDHSELEYNYRLVEDALGLELGSLPRETLKLVAPASATELLRSHGLDPQSYFVVHPGMGGSALNWPTANYIDLCRRLTCIAPVVITGTASDEEYLAPIRGALASNGPVIWLDGKLKGPELISVLAKARHVVAPSTGVLHLAASTGVPTLGIFSPVRVQHPRRWGPQGVHVATVVPPVDCPGEMSCLGPVCPHFNCMTQITVEQVARLMSDSPPVQNN